MKKDNSEYIAKMQAAMVGMRQAMMRRHGECCGREITASSFVLLQKIEDIYFEDSEAPITVTDLAQRTGITLSAITQTLNILEERRLISRRQRRDDKRFTDIVLTRKAKMIIRHRAGHSKVLNELFDYLGPKDSAEFVRLAERATEFVVKRKAKKD
jgi:DNA-binding MarR family transcriptional regulator